jgi:hypothetical protein
MRLLIRKNGLLCECSEHRSQLCRQVRERQGKADPGAVERLREHARGALEDPFTVADQHPLGIDTVEPPAGRVQSGE